MKAPIWAGDPSTQPIEYIRISDAISVDTTSPPFMQTQSISMQLGISQYGEGTGVTAQLFGPLGIYSVPIPSLVGKPGTQILSWVRNSDHFAFAGRDVANQYKAGTVNSGEIAMYAPGAPNVNRVYMDINGNCFIQSISQTNLQVINGQAITIKVSELDLGTSPTDAVALGSVLTLLINSIQKCVPSPQETGLASIKAALTGITSSQSTIVKVQP